MQKTWFITGANRGFGAEIATAALGSGDRVVAAGRSRTALIDNLGPDSERLLSVELDVTDADQARAAIAAAASRFGTIDVLVNNAGYGHLGFFEETTSQDAHSQFDTNVFGVFNVTRAALPIMRLARKGLIFNMSSLGGVLGAELCSLYCASKFALEGFSESLSKELEPFGISVVLVEPGPFRTDFLASRSIRYGANAVADYDDRRDSIRAAYEQLQGQQPGDPTKLAAAMVRLSREARPPLHFIAGSIALQAADAKLAAVRAEFDGWRQLSISTDGNYDA